MLYGSGYDTWACLERPQRRRLVLHEAASPTVRSLGRQDVFGAQQQWEKEEGTAHSNRR